MKDYTSHEYDECRDAMRKARKKEKTWAQIRREDRPETLEGYIEDQNFDANISVEDWLEISRLEEKDEQERIEINRVKDTLVDATRVNNLTVPKDVRSAWQCYKRRLRSKGFGPNTLEMMEKKTFEILQRLSLDTVGKDQAIKGLVIGNVQSGKTANMAGLMAMAADWGWNFFIVLSGTIENLRQQTQKRLLKDLVNDKCNVKWEGLEHLSNTTNVSHLQDKNLGEESKIRYLTVNLKYKSRLEGLVQWLATDAKRRQQLKILVIDDEADQAGINTAKIKEGDITTISNLIRNLVNGCDANGIPIDANYCAMNYIGYTATPYANILNEAPTTTNLYPSSFITTLDPVLKASKEYFGPQQIFGLDGDDYEEEDKYQPLGIVRTISKNDENQVKEMQQGKQIGLPSVFWDAVCWFICGTACMRYWGYRKPISLLIHTSQTTNAHEYLSLEIRTWLTNNNISDIVSKCRDVWEEETTRFTLNMFRQNYPDYGCLNQIKDYPSFADIESFIKELLQKELTHIQLDEDGNLDYHKGIHLCVDNCRNNGIVETDDGTQEKVRLIYPGKEKLDELGFAPAFIVIGGSTLSRGLTIEGLISTFFMRDSTQEDTLMQMGRWFGYRKGYELIPRVWMPNLVEQRFKVMSKVDFSLRQEIQEMAHLGKSPSEYAPKIINSPKLAFLRITAKSRMQGAEVNVNYSGSYNQTYLFDNDQGILDENIATTEDFLVSLGLPEQTQDINKKHVGNAKIWRNVDYQKVVDFISKFSFQRNQVVFANKQKAIEWIEKNSKKQGGKNDVLPPWSIVLASNNDNNGKHRTIAGHQIYMVNRSRKTPKNQNDVVLNIGALRNPSDIVADVDLTNYPGLVGQIVGVSTNDAKEVRRNAGLENIPQMIIYIIDKDSVPKRQGTGRIPLSACQDIVGVCINIPELKGNVETVSVRMPNNNDEPLDP